SESVFAKIQNLLRSEPFLPFTLRSGDEDIEVSHPNAVAFHPEVPFLTVYTRAEIYDLPIDKIAFVRRQHAH
ncbi:MAG: hypothetical protein ABI614_19595, partial [Planctomycetota bacterium]